MNFELFPLGFYAVLLLLGIGIGFCATGLRQGWGVPAAVVLLTVGAWYVGDAVYNNYEEYFWEFGTDTLTNAWLQVALFLLVFLVLLKPMHFWMNKGLAEQQSFAVTSYEEGTLGAEAVQKQITAVSGVIFFLWFVLLSIALVRVNWDWGGLFVPFLTGYKAEPWARGRIGGSYDALIALASYLQIFLTAAAGLVWALSRDPRARLLAGLIFALTLPYYLFDRSRNVMIAVLMPGVLAWSILRLQAGWVVRGLVLTGIFLALNFWMIFVMSNREVAIARAFQTEEAFERAQEGQHVGLNMFEELAWVNHFLKLGAIEPSWGGRYFAELVNPIPRALWPGKPGIGLDYSMARGQIAVGEEGDVTATVSTGMIGQGVINFGRFFGPMFAALLMAVWVALLARQDLLANRQASRFLLYALGLILTFNMGRDITFLVTFPFVMGFMIVFWLERRHGGAKGRRERRPQAAVATNGSRDERKERLGVADYGLTGPRDSQRSDGGTVRTMPGRVPKRVAAWMPRRVRQQVAAEQRAAAETEGQMPEASGQGAEVEGQNNQQKRLRQVGVPFRNYRRYRG